MKGFIFLSFLLLLGSCRDEAAYRRYQSVPIEGWDSQDAVTFDVDTIRTTRDYNVAIGVRTSAADAYPFKELYLEIIERWEHPKAEYRDTVGCILTDDRGEVEGKGTQRYQYEYDLHRQPLRAGQTGRVSVRHVMRREIISGISDIGLLVE